MIRVRLAAGPPELTERGLAELELAIAHYTNPANQGKTFSFRAYKLDTVKDALNAMFQLKCAYCESYFGGTQPLDVEHFRPKSAVLVDGELRWGLYHWLAASWGNLLPSCTDCNRPRKQRLPDGTTITLGKANQFPLATEASRAQQQGDEPYERRLLIHPCLDQPERHLRFDSSEGMVTGTTRKGRESIRVYALLRDGLVRARKARQLEILTQLVIARRLALKIDRDGVDADTAETLRIQKEALERFMRSDAPFAGMARQMIQPVLEELTQ